MRRLSLIGALATGLALSLGASPALAYKVKDKPLPNGQDGVAYSYQFEGDGGTAPHKFRILNGSLPAGLSLSQDGAVTGTPNGAGTLSFWVQGEDSTGLKSERLMSLTIESRLLIATSAVPIGTVGVQYGLQLSVTGGVATSWSVTSGSLPPGLVLTSGGAITGTPVSQAVSSFAIRAANGSKSDTRTFVLVIVAPVTISAESLPPAIVGFQFATKLAAAGGAGGYFFQVLAGALPSGLVFDGASGVILGTPLRAGTFPLAIRATASGGGAAQWNLRLVVRPRLGFTGAKLPKGRLGRVYTGRIAVRGGSAPVAFESVSLLPRGLRLNGETGRFSGRPRTTGTYRLKVTARDSFGGVVTKQFVLRVTR